MPGLSVRAIDRKTGIKGFGDALIMIGWLADHPEGVRIVRFDEHNGSSAKKRCQTAKRVANFKAANGEVTQEALPEHDECVSPPLPREREREESKPSFSEQTTSTTNTVSSPADVSPSSPSPIFQDRGKTLAARLAKLEASRVGKPVRFSDKHPAVQAWVDAGITDPQLREAYEIAVSERIETGDPAPINAGFLDVFVAKVLNPSDAPSSVVGVKKAWHETASGIEAKGRELGIHPPLPETGGFPVFRERVLAAAREMRVAA